jgi:tetratricopeptide (TPR) repeat protein
LTAALALAVAFLASWQWTRYSTNRRFTAHCDAGRQALDQKHYRQAELEFTLALHSRDDALCRRLLGQTLLRQSNPDAAFAQFAQAAKLNPKSAEVFSIWGRALITEGKPDDASRVFRQGLDSNPDSGLLHYDMAAALLQLRDNAQGRFRAAISAGKTEEAQTAQHEADSLAAEALAHFANADSNGAASPAFCYDYGQLLNQVGRYDRAESFLSRAVKADPSSAAAHYQLALAQARLGNDAEAIAHYEKVLQLMPDDPATLNSLALLYALATNNEVRSPRMAVQLAVRACDATTSQNARYMDTLARSYAALGDFFQAITWEDKAIHRARQLGDVVLMRELEARYTLYLDHKNPDQSM